jgi:hypothetical protein
MIEYNQNNVEEGDYVEIEYDGWLRVTATTDDGFNSVNSSLDEMIHLPFGDIKDLKLESEMSYNF